MKAIILPAILSIAMLFGGCSTPQQRVQEQISQGVYAEHDSMAVGRFDLAKNYNDGLVKTVPPPKHRIPIKGIYQSQP